MFTAGIVVADALGRKLEHYSFRSVQNSVHLPASYCLSYVSGAASWAGGSIVKLSWLFQL